jgi:hypothetical protein
VEAVYLLVWGLGALYFCGLHVCISCLFMCMGTVIFSYASDICILHVYSHKQKWIACHSFTFIQKVLYVDVFSTHAFISVTPHLTMSNYYRAELEDINGVLRIRKSKKYRQHNGQKKKGKRTHNDLQNIHIKLKIE